MSRGETMKRREFIGAALTGSAALIARGHFAAPQSRLADSRIEILTGEPIGKISPDIYGHFVEHLGGVVYDGIWVGEDSKVRNIGGIGEELVGQTRRITTSVAAAPGGRLAIG